MIEMSTLEQLDTFRECGTLSAAAEKLHLAQPSLSRSMKKLEEELGVTLFDRQKNKITLNETGMLAAEHAQRILQSESDMERHVRDFDRSLHTLSIGTCAPGPLFDLLPKASCRFQDVSVSSEMETEKQLLDGLHSHKYNLIILNHPLDDPAYISTRYITEQLYITVPKGHLLSSREEISFEELDGLTFIMNAYIGIWDDLKALKMPHSTYIRQQSSEAVDELQKHSDLPGFATDLGQQYGHSVVPNRVNIKVSDPEACMSFYLICDKTTKARWKALFEGL